MKSYMETHSKRSEILDMQQPWVKSIHTRLDLNYTRENISYEQKHILQKKNHK
jgi:hypothetical protein